MTIERNESPESIENRRWTATDAANFMFDRFIVEPIEGAIAAGNPRRRPDGSGDRLTSSAGQLKIQSSLARSVDLYADLFQRVFSSFASDITQNVAMQGTGAAPPAPVVLTGRPGTVAGAVVWIHNTSGDPAPEFTLRMTDLSRADGSVVSWELATTNPNRFGPSTHSRRSTWLSLTIPDQAGPGIYHGHLLADGLYDAAVALRLVVR